MKTPFYLVVDKKGKVKAQYNQFTQIDYNCCTSCGQTRNSE